jgi:ElaB/YqjD/DUF883 family membrane-anchored ribosome-binding protein
MGQSQSSISETNNLGAEYEQHKHQKGGFRLRDELSNLKSDLDALMTRTSSISEKETREAREKIISRFNSAKSAMKDFANETGLQINEGVEQASDYVQKRPVQSVLLAAVIGLALGALLRRG